MRTSLFIALIAMATVIAGAAEMMPVEISSARKMYAAKCAKCHKFYDPTAYDTEQWNVWMQRMRRKARLNETQFTALSRYLETVREHGQSKRD